MAKHNKLDAILKQRNPLEERQVITPVDVLAPTPVEPTTQTERLKRTEEARKRTPKANAQSERTRPQTAATKRTAQPNALTERPERTVLDELHNRGEETKRQTERYSFEIYTDQKERIEELRLLYYKRTGKKLSVSRIIREALEGYLTETLKVLHEDTPKE